MLTTEIFAFNLQVLQDKIDYLNNKAQKMGQSPITMTVVNSFTKKIRKTEYTKLNITIEGESPKFDGWRLLAVIIHEDDMSILNIVPGEEIPQEYRDADGYHCDHCGKSIRRKETYVIGHDNGAMKRVGSTCIKDFLGHTSVRQLAAWADLLSDIEEAIESADDFFGFCRDSGRIDIKLFLRYTILEIIENGYVSKSKAAEDFYGISTVQAVWSRLDELKKSPREAQRPTSDMVEKARKVYEWAISLEPGSNDYLYNLQRIASTAMENYHSVSTRFVGYVASMPTAYDRAMKREQERKQEQKNLKHVGTVGKREVFTLTLVGEHVTRSEWGSTSIYNFVDKDGNKVVWFSSSNQWLEVGETYQGKATVKEHSEYRGVPQTKITRFYIK